MIQRRAWPHPCWITMRGARPYPHCCTWRPPVPSAGRRCLFEICMFEDAGVDASPRFTCSMSVARNHAARVTGMDESCGSCMDWSLRECPQSAQQEAAAFEAQNVLHVRATVLQRERYYCPIVSRSVIRKLKAGWRATILCEKYLQCVP